MDQGLSSLNTRPYSQYSTSSGSPSVEPVSAIVGEKGNSSLNNAM